MIRRNFFVKQNILRKDRKNYSKIRFSLNLCFFNSVQTLNSIQIL